MNNPKEMDKFLEMHSVPRLNQEEIENMNRPITSTEIETVIKNLPTNKSILRDYCKQLYADKMDNLEEMDKSLERYNLPRLNQEEIENMNR